MKSNVRLYRPGDEQGIVDLHNIVFPDNPLDLATWRWKFEGNPTGLKWIAEAFTDEGTTIGHFSLVPMEGLVRGKGAIITQAVDVMIHPAYRGAILGRNNIFARCVQLLIETYEGRCPLSYGFPAPRHLKLGKILLRYNPLYKVPRYAFDLTSWEKDRKRSLRGRFLVKEITSFDERADKLWQSIEHEHPYDIIRNSPFLNWRYRDCPNKNYKLFCLTEPLGKWKAWAVLSLQKGKARMIDLLIPEYIPAGSEELVLALLDRAAAEGAEYMETWIPASSPATPLLLSLGFRKMPVKRPLSATVRIQDESISPAEVAENFQFQMGYSDIY